MAIVCPILARPSSGFEVVLRREQWELVRCRETGFVFLANPPVYNQLKSEFAWEKTYEAEKKRRQETEPTVYAASQIAKDIKFKINPRRNRIADMAVRAVTGSGSRNVRILDIGCGSGRLMLELCQRYEKQNVQAVPFGIEVSEQLAAESSNIVTPLGGAIIKNHAVGGCRMNSLYRLRSPTFSCGNVLHASSRHQVRNRYSSFCRLAIDLALSSP